MTCGRGVPSLACAACLCLYHPACAGHTTAPGTFFCKNCRKSSTPPPEPPPLTHKSGVPAPPAPRRVPAAPAAAAAPDQRVLLRMKVAGGGPDGARVWAVAAPAPARALLRAALPQSLAVLNGRRFIIVPRALVNPDK
ncbi:uncharacterized protein [Choristoneura fumiferana]|uniref:uncharacterized protein n=1 Tax=Choristoneura fumiferana TaxID=7141 RepID=UPI003D155BEB